MAYVAKDHDAEVIDLGPMGTRPCDMDQLVRQRHANAPHLVFVDEAGPCGDWLSRYWTPKGYDCWIVAPALIPTKAGDRVNTDRRDAVQVARLRRSGDLAPVDVPKVADEAMRDLRRARDDTLHALKTATCRLNAFLLRHAIRYTGRATWGPAHLRWLSAVVCPTPAPPIVFHAYVRAVTEHTERLQRLEQARHEQAKAWRLYPVVEALQALRGVPLTGAVTLIAERGDLTRCDHPRQRMKYLGLTPAEYASGERRRQGGIPKTGNTHARRALVAGAWAYRSPANVSRHVPLRLEKLPKPRQDISWKAHVRLCQRHRRLMARGQHANQVVVAMARERAGFLWAIAKQGPVTPSIEQRNRHEPSLSRLPRLLEEAPPRCGATLDRVKRPAGLLAPRVRQAPDGCTSDGSHPTAISVITRRM